MPHHEVTMPLSTYPSSIGSNRANIRPPATLTLAITSRCNLSCSHCWVEAGQQAEAFHVPEWLLLNMVEQFLTLGGEHIRFTGGEPLLHPGWLRVMQFASTIGLDAITLQTNAMLLTERKVSQLRRSHLPGLSIQISLDGATASSHDRVRGSGAFAAALQGIRLLVQEGFGDRITVTFTEMRHNLEEFPKLLQLAEELKVAAVVAGTLIKGGRAAGCAELVPPDSSQYARLIERYDNDRAFRSRYDAMGSMAALTWRNGDTLRDTCCTFAEHPYLTPDGRLYPCLFCHADEYTVHGVYENGLEAALSEGAELWSPLLEISRRRAAALVQCRDCPGAAVCVGGCMGRAWSSCGSLWAPDDRCEQRRAIYHAFPPDKSRTAT
jgi:radical SAM protein with 4Fe4S-binding SPASM domain